MTDARQQQARLDTFVATTEIPTAILALFIAPAIMLESHGPTPLVRSIAFGVNWFVWLTLGAAYIVKIVLAPDRRRFVLSDWVDLLMIVLSSPIPMWLDATLFARVIDLLRFVRGAAVAALSLRITSHLLRPHRFHYVALTTALVISLGALGIFAFESGKNSHIQTFGDAMWWAIVTATTVGYGDVSPVTAEGRVIAVSLMLLGIGFVGIFTATISNVFFDQGRVNVLEDRLARMEAKLDAVLQRQQANRASGLQ
jgi:voltage-gated potassium channel